MMESTTAGGADTTPGNSPPISRILLARVPPARHGVPQHTAPNLASSTSLLSLPTELLCMVMNHLRKYCYLNPLVNLARTCKRLLHLITPILFRNLRTPLPPSRRVGSSNEHWSMRSVYNLLRALEQNPQLRNYVQSIVFIGNEGGDTLDLSNWDVPNNAQNESSFNKLLDRYVERSWRIDGEHRPAREYPLQLTLLLCLLQKTLSQAHIRVPPHFWIPNPIEELRRHGHQYGFILDNQNAYNIPNGIILKPFPTFKRLSDLTLEGTSGFLNTKTTGMLLRAMPTLTRLTFRNCTTTDKSGTIVIPEHISSLTLDRCSKLRRQYKTVPNPMTVHGQLRSFFLNETLSDLRGVYASDSGLEKHPKRSGLLVQVLPDENIPNPAQNGVSQSSTRGYTYYSQADHMANNCVTGVLKFLSPAALSLERIYLGDCGRQQLQARAAFRGFPNLKTISIHCSNLSARVDSRVLVDSFRDCQSLKVIEVVGVDRIAYFSRLFLALAKAIERKEDGCFTQLKKVILVCHDPGRAMEFILDPFAAMFSEGRVELVLMAREGWEDNTRAAYKI